MEGEGRFMQVSSRFTIALHMFAAMDYFKDKNKITSDFLASSINVNPVIIRKIMSQLRDAGLVKVQRGTGGIELTRKPEEITFFDIFTAVESLENGQLFHFHENPNAQCPVGRNIHGILDDKLADIQSGLEDKLRSYTLADVIWDTDRMIVQED
jgi:Rrf2 family protein